MAARLVSERKAMRIVVSSRMRLMGESLVQSLAASPDVAAVKFCPRSHGIIEIVEALAADVVLLDMTGERRLDDIRAASAAVPQARLIALGIPETPEDVIGCADAGCSGFVSNEASIEELLTIIGRVMQDEVCCPPKIAACLLREVRRRRSIGPARATHDSLTGRERQVLVLVARGLSNKEIAAKLMVSLSTVKNHLHNVFRKLRVKGRAQALMLISDEPWLLSSA